MHNRLLLFALCLLLVGGCAQAPVVEPPARLFRDELFAAPSQRMWLPSNRGDLVTTVSKE